MRMKQNRSTGQPTKSRAGAESTVKHDRTAVKKANRFHVRVRGEKSWQHTKSHDRDQRVGQVGQERKEGRADMSQRHMQNRRGAREARARQGGVIVCSYRRALQAVDLAREPIVLVVLHVDICTRTQLQVTWQRQMTTEAHTPVSRVIIAAAFGIRVAVLDARNP